MTANVPLHQPSPADLLGMITIGKTAYQVYRLGVGENSRRAGIRHNFALFGPRGASYFVTDHGPHYLLNSTATGGGVGWTCAPRSLRGLTREHLAPFGVEITESR